MQLSTFFFLLLVLQGPLWAQGLTPTTPITIGTTIELESTILGETRSIQIYQPEGLWGMDASMRDLPVIVVLDGETLFLPTVATVDFLSAAPIGNDFMPRSIVVGIPNTNRNRDLTPVKGILANDTSTLAVTGGGQRFLDFITEELLPFIDSNYNTSAHRTLMGHSLGGLLTFEALLNRHTHFNHYIAIDPGLGFANGTYLQQILDALTQADRSEEQLFFATANTNPTFLTAEEALQDESDFMQMISIPNHQFLQQIPAQNWSLQVMTQNYPKENHFSVPQRAAYDAFKAFYPYYPFPAIRDYYHPSYKDRTDLVERIKAHYQTISTQMGYQVLPMEGYLNSFAFGIAPSGRADLAIALFEYNIALHPNNPALYNNLGYFYQSRGNKKAALRVYQQSLKLKEDEYISGVVEALKREIRGE